MEQEGQVLHSLRELRECYMLENEKGTKCIIASIEQHLCNL